MSTKIFVNLPVKDLGRSMAFFEKLGFRFNPQFTDETAACMVITEYIYAMLLTHPKFKVFTKKAIADAHKTTEVLTCLAVDSKHKVDELVGQAIAAGGTEARDPQDYGFMYGRSFNDLDGHIWEIVWMDPSHIQQSWWTAAKIRAEFDLQPNGASMLKIIKITAIFVAAAIAVLLAYAATRPDQFQVQRSTSISASAEKIFPFINDLRGLNSWNPFVRKDPASKGTYGGPSAGKGAAYAFEGGKGGTGRLEIVDTSPPASVIMRLTMSKPIAADNRIAFTLEPQGYTTRVTWAMDGQVPFAGKVMHLFFDVDKMLGREFEDGLADLKALAERSSAASR